MSTKKLKDLVTRPVPAIDAGQVTLKIEPGVKEGTIINRLEDYFIGDEDRQAVRIIFADGKIGLLRRSSLSALAAGKTRGIGDSGGASLPGDDAGGKLIELCCAQPNCAYKLLVSRNDPEDPYFCELHPASEMRLCQ